MSWVVKHYTRGVNPGDGPKETEQYLAVINHNPYNRHDRVSLTTLFVQDQREAFKFDTKSAAEVAAVWVGGEVVKYKPFKTGLD